MFLKPGSRLGNYEITALVGVGGMGEVYKARDPKLNRFVALKVLPPALAGNRDFLARFDREAKAVAALSHPNVLGIFDLATQDGMTYAVMELLEGETLRDKLKGGALSPKRAIEIATEVALGLGAAHERGIIHRDVKPENIFITGEGRVKVLDFGLAKQATTAKSEGSVLETAAMGATLHGTEAGMVLGTVGYMSPEQVKGEVADHRADVFAFGVVLFEMLNGQRPFKGETAHHTMTAILDQEPPALVAGRGPLPPALERLVAHCLEKNPKARFQSMADIAFALQNLSTQSSTPQRKAMAPARSRYLAGAALATAVLAAALGLLAWAGRLHLGRGPLPPSFTRLTFAPGTVESAFFGTDGRTVYFSERIQGGKPELYVLHPGSPEPQPLGVKDALLLGVSPAGDLAILRYPGMYFGALVRGTLAQVSGGGGSVREIREGVVDATWDGPGFATATDWEQSRIKVEFAGKVMLEGEVGNTNVHLLRRSANGGLLAMVVTDGSKTQIVTFDPAGHRGVRYTKFDDALGSTITGLAWGSDGGLWFSELSGDQTSVWSLPERGARRLLWRGEGSQALMDVAPDGRMLMADQQCRRGVLVQKPGEAVAQDLSIATGTQAQGFSADGKSLLLLESPVMDGGTPYDRTYLWTREGNQTVRLANGTGTVLTADGRWVFMQYNGFDPKALDSSVSAALREVGLEPKAILDPDAPAPYILFIPTAAGQPFALSLPPKMEQSVAGITPDGKRLVFIADEHGPPSWYVIDRTGGAPRVVTPPGFGTMYAGLDPLSPDGANLIVGRNGQFYIQSLAGGLPQPIKGLAKDERPIGWGREPHSIFIRNRTLQVVVSRLDLATGARKQVFTYTPGDASGLMQIRIWTPPSGSIFALSYVRTLSNLYLVEGVQ